MKQSTINYIVAIIVAIIIQIVYRVFDYFEKANYSNEFYIIIFWLVIVFSLVVSNNEKLYD